MNGRYQHPFYLELCTSLAKENITTNIFCSAKHALIRLALVQHYWVPRNRFSWKDKEEYVSSQDYLDSWEWKSDLCHSIRHLLSDQTLHWLQNNSKLLNDTAKQEKPLSVCMAVLADSFHSLPTVNVLKFQTLYSIPFWPEFCFLCICFL